MTTATQRMLAAIRELAPAITARATEIEAGREVPYSWTVPLRQSESKHLISFEGGCHGT